MANGFAATILFLIFLFLLARIRFRKMGTLDVTHGKREESDREREINRNNTFVFEWKPSEQFEALRVKEGHKTSFEPIRTIKFDQN
ncbi:hypothetical protein NECAME_16015 [Necator americanus]|uniref:Uncharacterized protein n=1 Tax=Necator americanus TaxID=51031 RepID=W2TYP6_NECAM|nr:hypothetical protein NECAME_16015 [Necator americanus]ETN86978.1 hypothetical protein NECAME_16015 [Necator americanus]